ncbi:hypothetical protein BDZ91DRAFT_803436 [Kalaharituber pfeilii]|nr:hypothetical protein BDZ91DRAFT_803436 [Kalaharituber pfeilii]
MSDAEGKRRFERVREVNAEGEATMPIRKPGEYAEVFHKHIRSLVNSFNKLPIASTAVSFQDLMANQDKKIKRSDVEHDQLFEQARLTEESGRWMSSEGSELLVRNWRSRDNITFIQEDQQWTLHKFQEAIEFTKKRDEREGERLVKATEGPNRVITIEEIQDGTVATQDIIDFIEKSEAMDPFPPEDQIEDSITVAQYQVNNTHDDGEYVICTPGEDDTYSDSSIRTVTAAPRTVKAQTSTPPNRPVRHATPRIATEPTFRTDPHWRISPRGTKR